ncbi:hypothetical protein BDQ12DRAFT_691801 [Crucibulum laeve]|uniref:Uncharacterized protein n=1 Tax=Crucibulum laeve TaxID=68775 RepID=A0A5C3LKX3_9AGAR|nr:hypothetical protein BDQ12DRAFT_691801 [Crucibulum laeve]
MPALTTFPALSATSACVSSSFSGMSICTSTSSFLLEHQDIDDSHLSQKQHTDAISLVFILLFCLGVCVIHFLCTLHYLFCTLEEVLAAVKDKEPEIQMSLDQKVPPIVLTPITEIDALSALDAEEAMLADEIAAIDRNLAKLKYLRSRVYADEIGELRLVDDGNGVVGEEDTEGTLVLSCEPVDGYKESFKILIERDIEADVAYVAEEDLVAEEETITADEAEAAESNDPATTLDMLEVTLNEPKEERPNLKWYERPGDELYSSMPQYKGSFLELTERQLAFMSANEKWLFYTPSWLLQNQEDRRAMNSAKNVQGLVRGESAGSSGDASIMSAAIFREHELVPEVEGEDTAGAIGTNLVDGAAGVAVDSAVDTIVIGSAGDEAAIEVREDPTRSHIFEKKNPIAQEEEYDVAYDADIEDSHETREEADVDYPQAIPVHIEAAPVVPGVFSVPIPVPQGVGDRSASHEAEDELPVKSDDVEVAYIAPNVVIRSNLVVEDTIVAPPASVELPVGCPSLALPAVITQPLTLPLLGSSNGPTLPYSKRPQAVVNRNKQNLPLPPIQLQSVPSSHSIVVPLTAQRTPLQPHNINILPSTPSTSTPSKPTPTSLLHLASSERYTLTTRNSSTTTTLSPSSSSRQASQPVPISDLLNHTLLPTPPVTRVTLTVLAPPVTFAEKQTRFNEGLGGEEVVRRVRIVEKNARIAERIRIGRMQRMRV